jgi:hypothetical protein
MGIEVFVLFGDDGFTKERRDLIELCFHPPLLIAGEVSIDHFTFIVRDDGGILDMIGDGKKLVEQEEQQKQADQGYPQFLEGPKYIPFGDPYSHQLLIKNISRSLQPVTPAYYLSRNSLLFMDTFDPSKPTRDIPP